MKKNSIALSQLSIIVSTALILGACSGDPIRGKLAGSFGADQQSAGESVAKANRQAQANSQARSEAQQVVRKTNAEYGQGGGSVISEQSQEINRLRRELTYAELHSRSGGVVFVNTPTDPAQPVAAGDEELLPPNARPGECFARVWVGPRYEEYSERVLVREAAEEVTVIPAKYAEVDEQIMVSAESTRYETKPAVFETISEDILVSEGERSWHVNANINSAPANAQLLEAARAGGINLEAATPGMCFHEHYEPARYDNVSETVTVRQADEQIEVSEPQYEWVDKEVVVKEASLEMRTIPAEYDYVDEKVIDKPAHTVWKKGTGPIQRIDEATGEIMCLVEVPATYKTIRKRIMVSPARTERVEIPEVSQTIKVKVLASEARTETRTVPAQQETFTKRVKVADEQFVWHEIQNKDHPANTRTGNQICLLETQDKYRTVERQVVKTPAQRIEHHIPAEYKSVKVRKLVSEAQEIRTPIAAEYDEVTHQRMVADGYMEWRLILCDTNMTRERISDIQRALEARGYNPGHIDGVIGSQTMTAVKDFQRANGLPVDEYLNIATVEALGVSPR